MGYRSSSPRGQAPFSLQKRPASKKEAEKKRGGKKYRYVYYAQFRDQEGNYTSAVSTGESSEGAARPWAMQYLRKGNIPTHRGNTVAKFAANWWVPGECLYLKEQEASGYKKSPEINAEEPRADLVQLLHGFRFARHSIELFDEVPIKIILAGCQELRDRTVERNWVKSPSAYKRVDAREVVPGWKRFPSSSSSMSRRRLSLYLLYEI